MIEYAQGQELQLQAAGLGLALQDKQSHAHSSDANCYVMLLWCFAVCQPGFGRAHAGADHCVRCVQGTYAFGDAFDECFECPFPKTTGFSGATSDRDCGE